MVSIDEIIDMRERWLALADRVQGQEFASERDWLSDEEKMQLPGLLSQLEDSFEQYAQSLSELRQDRENFERWVESMNDDDDAAEVRRRKRDMKFDIWWDWICRSHSSWEPSVLVRAERDEDHYRVEELVQAAFGQAEEAELVAGLRKEPKVISLVGEREGVLVGHIMFSPVKITGGEPAEAMALAPVAVDLAAQGLGVGSALVQAGLDACWEAKHELCFVRGDPAYYEGFSFVAAAPRWRSSRPGAEEAFQVVFESWIVSKHHRGGEVVYCDVFDAM